MLEELRDFCGNVSFWDTDLLLNSSWPHFTTCFQQTLLAWLPCLFLWITAPPYLFYITSIVGESPNKITWLNTSKVFIPLALCLLCVVKLLKTASLDENNQESSALYVALGLISATYLYSGILVHLERSRGFVTSGIQFIFWLLVTLTNIIPFYTSILQNEYDTDVFNFSLIVIHFGLVVIMLFLQFFADASKDGYIAIGQKEISPLLMASFPSRLTFWWTQPMLRLGYKRPLTTEDIFPLDPQNQSQTVVPIFKETWYKEKARAKRRNEKRLQRKLKVTYQVNKDNTKEENLPLISAQNSSLLASTPGMTTTSFIQQAPANGSIQQDANSDSESQKLSTTEQNGGISNGLNDLKTAHGNRIGVPHTVNRDTNKRGSATEADIGVKKGPGKTGGGPDGGGGGPPPAGGGPRQNRPPRGGGQKNPAFLILAGDKDTVRPSLFRVLAKTFWASFFLCQSLQLMVTLLQFVNPKVLNALLDYVSHRSSYQPWLGYVLACSFFVASLLSTLISHQSMHTIQPMGMRIRSSIISAVYEKALTMSHESKRQATVGEIVNLMSIDCQRLGDFPMQLYILWSGPLTISIALYQLWGILGPSSLAGLAVLILVIPINGTIVSRLRRLQVGTMFMKDRRIKLMTQVLNGIKVLKLYAWEKSFEDKILELRDQELSNLRRAAILQAGAVFMWTLVPYLVTLASFTAYILVSDLGYLDPAKAFVSLSLFNIMRQPINMLPNAVPSIIQASVSMTRVNTFLNWGDIDSENVKRDPNAKYAISINNGTFTWDLTFPRSTLQNINLNIPRGKLVAVVGSVGCGKSSLLAAILGEMNKRSGTVTVKNSIAYVPQEAWIQNATVRDNILFGKRLSHRRYNLAIKACALESDLEILVGGDLTEIGEKGINLSGGQRQRVSLARAVYSDADTYLLDDPLSAVDTHVGKHIFQQVIGNQGMLARKTRILVTHGVHWLPMTDLIVVLNNGTISEMGTYEDLLSKDGDFAEFLKTYLAMEDESDVEIEEDPEIVEMKEQIRSRLASIASYDTATSGDERGSTRDLELSQKRRFQRQRSNLSESMKSLEVEKEAKKQDAAKLVMEEQAMTGDVNVGVYLMYLRALGGLAWVGILLWYCIYQASSFSSSIWLSQWTDDSMLANISLAGTPEYNDRNSMYLGVYGALGVAQAIFILGYNMMSNTRMVRAAGNLHAAMLSNILKSPMSFFDTTPVGRIINRHARDVDVCDTALPMSFRQTISGTGSFITTITLIAYSSPIFLAVIIPLGVIYKLLQNFYIASSRQLKRLESTTRSPVYTHFTETIQGATSIRAYGVKERFMRESEERVDKNLTCFYSYIVTQRWLGVRLECMGSLITLAAALFAVINQDLSSGLVGLSVTYAMNVTGALNMLVRMSSELETNIVSAERIKEYAEKETEAPWKGPKYPSDQWPEEGCVEFKDYQTRYRPGLDLVIRGLTCSIRGGEKVGIVGRTGAGKSSLTLALFRLIEAAAGRIIIDGETISDIGLHDLRGRLTILPQDAVIFSGTLRMNLDPIGKHSDDEIWQALDHSHLAAFVRSLPNHLDYECGEGGQNLSVGQRQLICLARSLLRKSKILVLDEATAAVDMETDDLIQRTIRTEFKDSTVLTIAHRLNTILDYDRIMVMDQGNIIEFASPKELLADPNSQFYGMAKAAGLV